MGTYHYWSPEHDYGNGDAVLAPGKRTEPESNALTSVHAESRYPTAAIHSRSRRNRFHYRLGPTL